MSSYKIYLTKSSEVAHLISWALKETEHEGKIGTSSGMVKSDCRIPAIYHDKGYYYAILEYKNGDGWDNPKYDIVIA